jgi:hypothetical protein
MRRRRTRTDRSPGLELAPTMDHRDKVIEVAERLWLLNRQLATIVRRAIGDARVPVVQSRVPGMFAALLLPNGLEPATSGVTGRSWCLRV